MIMAAKISMAAGVESVGKIVVNTVAPATKAEAT